MSCLQEKMNVSYATINQYYYITREGWHYIALSIYPFRLLKFNRHAPKVYNYLLFMPDVLIFINFSCKMNWPLLMKICGEDYIIYQYMIPNLYHSSANTLQKQSYHPLFSTSMSDCDFTNYTFLVYKHNAYKNRLRFHKS